MLTSAALAASATGVMNGNERISAAQALVGEARSAGTSSAELRALYEKAMSIHVELTPAQQEAAAAGGPVTPNHAGLKAALDHTISDVALDAFAKGVRISEAASRSTAEALRVEITTPPLAGHVKPSAAAFAFLALDGASLNAEQVAQVQALDELPAAQAVALARTIDAFTTMELAAQDAITANPTAPEWGTVLGARIQLTDAIFDLQDSLPIGPVQVPMHNPVPIPPGMVEVAPYLVIDWSGMDDTYLENYHLSIDVGGSDTYLNNAGGTWIGNCELPIFAAAAIDLSLDLVENDRYTGNGNACGKNGGSMGGVGFLLDVAGDNEFAVGQSYGINGGAYSAAALGFLLSAGGYDRYNSGYLGTNGGAAQGGVGLLVDSGASQNSIAGGGQGSNGGAYQSGLGMMIDAGLGSGYYAGGGDGANGGANGAGSSGYAYGAGYFGSGSYGANGGGTNAGAGTLICSSFCDLSAGWYGTNGGGDNLGTGFALVPSGSAYAGGMGTNGGGHRGGHGTFVGATSMSAGSYGTNGGAYGPGASGFAIGSGGIWGGSHGSNGGADDNEAVGFLSASASWISAGSGGVNGGAANGAVGFLVNAAVGTYYSASGDGSNGGGFGGGHGLLVSSSLDDTYNGGSRGANGGGALAGVGFLIDLAGNDRYNAGTYGVNGGAAALASSGFLLDVQGHDYYSDSGTYDTTIVPKTDGISGGAQVDLSPV